jgi:hypothetical protein
LYRGRLTVASDLPPVGGWVTLSESDMVLLKDGGLAPLAP